MFQLLVVTHQLLARANTVSNKAAPPLLGEGGVILQGLHL
jgi:hypothetical protein